MSKQEYCEINTGRALLEYKQPLDYELMMRYLAIMSERYKFMSLTYIGESILGKGIPAITLGEGEKQILYVGAHSASDWLGAVVLLRFINEYCEAVKNDRRIFKYSVKYLFGTRRICVIPMLNPDGVDIRINGVDEDNILYSRLLSMNGGDDFSQWKANARGVTLSHNYQNGFAEYRKQAQKAGIVSGAPYGYCGESPESEPEIAAFCANIRFGEGLSAALSLDGEGERIFYKLGAREPTGGKQIAVKLAKMCGYRLQKDFEAVENGGFVGFCIDELNIPVFNFAYGKKQNINLNDTCFDVYAKVRDALFALPAMV